MSAPIATWDNAEPGDTIGKPKRTAACGCNILVVPAKLCAMHLAAPDLLAACEAALDQYGWEPQSESVAIKLRAAIAKAKGGAA